MNVAFFCNMKRRLMGLSSHPVGWRIPPETKLLPLEKDQINFPVGEYLFWRPADTSTVC